MRCRFDSGTLSFESEAPRQVRLAGVAPRVVVRVGDRRVDWQATSLREGPAGEYEAEHGEVGLRLTLRCAELGPGWVLTLQLRNEGGAPVAVEELAPLYVGENGSVRVGAGSDRWAVFRNGYQSWSGTRSYRMHEADHDPRFGFLRIGATDLRHRSAGRPGVLRSDLFTVIKNLRSGEALCLGFLDARRAFGGILVDAPAGELRQLAATCDEDRIEIAPGEALSSEPLYLVAGGDEEEVLEGYATLLGRQMGARVPAKSPSGWCSWYYYFTRVREETVLLNLERLQGLRDRFACDYFQVDDGYQRAIGDWLEANEKFPHGMRWMAERIRAAGFDPGIWLAPFMARRESRLFTEHRDWFVRSDTGGLRCAMWNPLWSWTGVAYALDTTHPEVLAWLEGLARTLVQEWGYRVLKLDFLFAAALPGVRRDPSATRAASLRRGLEAIRAGAGEDAFLLGCGCPLGPAVGVVDAMRIGPDVAPFWSLWFNRFVMRDLHGVATRHAVRNILTRAFLHRRLWLNDPDCLMLRSDETRLTREEIRTLSAVIGLTDGMLVVSDAMALLPGERLTLLEETKCLAGGTARVVDLFEQDVPELVVADRGDAILIGVFNFQNVAVRKKIDVARLGIWQGDGREVWSGTELTVEDGWLDVGEVPAHGSRVIRVHPQEPRTRIGSS